MAISVLSRLSRTGYTCATYRPRPSPIPQIHRYHRQRLFPAKPLRQIVTKAPASQLLLFAINAVLTMYAVLNRWVPGRQQVGSWASVILKKGFLGGLISCEDSEVSVNARRAPFTQQQQRTVMRPRLSLKSTMDVKKPGKSSQDQPGKDNFLFLIRLRTRLEDVPKQNLKTTTLRNGLEPVTPGGLTVRRSETRGNLV